MLWAQRGDTVLLTVDVTDIRDEKYSLDEKVFKFTGAGGPEGQLYSVELEFYGEIVPQVSTLKTVCALAQAVMLPTPHSHCTPCTPWPHIL